MHPLPAERISPCLPSFVLAQAYRPLEQMMRPDVLMYRRIRQTNKGKADRYAQHEYLHVLKHHLQQKRAHQ